MPYDEPESTRTRGMSALLGVCLSALGISTASPASIFRQSSGEPRPRPEPREIKSIDTPRPKGKRAKRRARGKAKGRR